jgi:hypothetical protein
MLDHLCALTGWNRDHARKALRQALGPPASRRSRTGAVTYGHEVLGPLRKIWAVLDVPAGKRLAPFLGEAMEAMERAGELRLGPEVRGKLLRVSAATRGTKAQRWVHEALAEVAFTLPFALLGLDSDNGSEFINNNLFAWCTEHHVTFTRSRPWRKNDNCFVEQKNWAVVRRAAGYLRYDSPQELRLLGELYRSLIPYVNFFQPQMKLVSKTRTGAKVRRRYDVPQTPYRRILASAEVPTEAKAALTAVYQELNPVALKRDIARCQTRLLDLARRRKATPTWTPTRDHPWRTTINQARSSHGAFRGHFR